MSAFGPKQTCASAPHMSAFGGKADMTGCGISLSRSLSGVKRTCCCAPHMSAFDPKRTFLPSVCSRSRLWNLYTGSYKQNACGLARGARHLWVAMHQRLRDRAFTKNHELGGKLVWVGRVELLKKRTKQRATFFLVRNGDLVSGVGGVSQLRNRVHKRAATIPI